MLQWIRNQALNLRNWVLTQNEPKVLTWHVVVRAALLVLLLVAMLYILYLTFILFLGMSFLFMCAMNIYSPF
jgi:hypothetical protein